MPEGPLRKREALAIDDDAPEITTGGVTNINLRDFSTEDGDLGFVSKVKNGMGSIETRRKAKQGKPETRSKKIEQKPTHREENTIIEVGAKDLEDATEEETKAFLLRKARIASNRLVPSLYVGEEQRRARAKTIDEQLETLGLGLAEARLKNNATVIAEIEERQIPLKAESERLSRYATAEEELTARITEMAAYREKLRAQKKRVSPVETALADLREVQTHLIEANTWRDPKKAADLAKAKADEELRLKELKEDAQRKFKEGKRLYQERINQKGSGSKAVEQRPGGLTLVQRLEKNLWDLGRVFKKKYEVDIDKAFTKTETISERAYSWWRDTPAGKFLSSEPELYGDRDRDKQSMLESYKKLNALYKRELEGRYIAEERQKKAAGNVIATPLEREREELASLVKRVVPTKMEAAEETLRHVEEAIISPLLSTKQKNSDPLLKKVVSPRLEVTREIVRPLAEMAAMPILAIAEPILSKYRWKREWEKKQERYSAELVNKIAESILDKHNENALAYVAEATGIAPGLLTIPDIAEFFYTTAEGDALREKLMSNLREQMKQREQS